MRNFYSLIFAMLFMSTITAQVRYVDEVFADVTVTNDVTYAANVTVITTLQGLPPMALPQNMDVSSRVMNYNILNEFCEAKNQGRYLSHFAEPLCAITATPFGLTSKTLPLLH